MERIREFLEERESEGLLRTLHCMDCRKEGLIRFNNKDYIDFCSNDYLGLSEHPNLIDASIKAAQRFGTSSSASRLLSGDLKIHHSLEGKIAEFKGKDSALVFNSGYQANIGIISSLYKKGDVIFSDRLNHASIIDAIMLSKAKLLRFNHNDLNHLEMLLKKERQRFKNSLIVTETVFSMDGDAAPLRGLVDLKEKYDCEIMVDEAHATGIFGQNGSGIVEKEGLTNQVDFIMGTFSKALGGFGAYLACSKRIKEFLINTCRSFIYSTALPPSVIAANLASLDLVAEEPFRRNTLLANAEYFRKELVRIGFKTRGLSQIIPIIVGDSKKAVKLSEAFKKKGYWTLPIRPPTVPLGEARLRFSLTYYHSRELLQKLIHDISKGN